MEFEIRKSLKHNTTVNLLDGGFFGFALGFASFVTVIPLFVSTMTDSAILIGLVPAIHSVGWQFPQLFTAHRVSKLLRYKPMVMTLTIQERLPFLGLALVAWYAPSIGVQAALVLTFLLLAWQGIGGGITANAWQTMIGKIIPSEYRGTFYGAQSSTANLMASFSAIVAGSFLENLYSPLDFSICFLLAFLAMVISWIFLSMTREPPRVLEEEMLDQSGFRERLKYILRNDPPFRSFLFVRMLSQLGVMGFAFYTVYAVQVLGMSKMTVGILTSVLMATQIIANPVMGWAGDRWSYRRVMELGLISAGFSAIFAWIAPSPNWFYLVMVLAGIANVAIWTIGMAMVQEYGSIVDRPAYIGLANTLIAPFTILAPFIGGWLADSYSYSSAFFASAVFGFLTAGIIHWKVKEQRSNNLEFT
jgi:MFS family permease